MQNRKKDKILFCEAINESIYQEMKRDKKVILFGLGVTDPKRVFGTTKNLIEIFGDNRVFEIPLSENAITGICLGASLSGHKPILSHQRVEFSLLAMEQIVNQISKWNFMTAGKKSPSLVIRLIIGRGWGQGPQHNQSLESMFSQIKGLKVVCPSNPRDAKGLLTSSIRDKSPVIFFEHRWLHEIESKVSKKNFIIRNDQPKIKKKGKDVTIVSYSYMMIECLKASKILNDNKISAEVIDLISLRPLKLKKIINSIKKTNNLLFVENGQVEFGIGSEISRLINKETKIKKNFNFEIIGLENSIIPSTRALAKHCYISHTDIINKVFEILKIKKRYKKKKSEFSDVPDKNFKGPF